MEGGVAVWSPYEDRREQSTVELPWGKGPGVHTLQAELGCPLTQLPLPCSPITGVGRTVLSQGVGEKTPLTQAESQGLLGDGLPLHGTSHTCPRSPGCDFTQHYIGPVTSKHFYAEAKSPVSG